MKQKGEITFEIEETIILRQGERKVKSFCPHCAALVEMASPYLTAMISNLSEREIFRLIERGRIHFIETNRVLICLDSLPISTKSLPKRAD
jgi:hypothetical protein